MPAVARTCVAGANFSQVGEPWLEIAACLHTAEMDVVPVRAHDVLALAERVVRDHVHGYADGADRSSARAEGLADLLVLGGPVGVAQGGEQLHLVQPVVASDERQHDLAVDRHRHRLRGRTRVDAEELRDPLDRALAGCLDLLGCRELLREVWPRWNPARDLEISRVIAVLADDEGVLPRAGWRKEVLAAAAAHDSRLGGDLHSLDPAALEDPFVGAGVLAEALVEAGGVAVERVGVLHDELAHADQPGARPGLVAVLDGEVVEDLRQLTVALDLAGVERDGLLVRHREDELAPGPVVQLEDL